MNMYQKRNSGSKRLIDPSSLAYCIYMKVIFQGLIKIREGIYKNAKNPQEPLY